MRPNPRWRTAHNPVNREILEYADRHGMLIWNENRNLERQVTTKFSSHASHLCTSLSTVEPRTILLRHDRTFSVGSRF